jgi:small subunit ribosomal protein S9
MTNFPCFAKTVGRRKTASANLELIPGSGQVKINGCLVEKSFIGYRDRLWLVQAPFRVSAYLDFNAKVKICGGGVKGRVDSLQIALARSLVIVQPQINSLFRENCFLTRDSREKERRKYGLKKARKAPQYSKR